MKFHGLLLILLATSCTQLYPQEVASNKITIVATIFPLAEFAEGVGGSNIIVRQLIVGNADPHAWQPKPSDMKKIQDASLFLFVDPALEPWTASLLPGFDGEHLSLKDVAQGDQGIGRDKEADPHIWLNFAYDMIFVNNISQKLSLLDPNHAEQYTKNAKKYLKDLQELDSSYKEGLSNCKKDTLVVGGHAAFGEFANRYRFRQLAVSGYNPQAEPSAQRLAKVISVLREDNIQYIVANPAEQKKNAMILASEINGEVLLVDPAPSSIKRNATFFSIMKENLAVLMTVLECR